MEATEMKVTPPMLITYFANNAKEHLVRSPEGELILAAIDRVLEDAVHEHEHPEYFLLPRKKSDHPLKGEPLRSIREGVVELFGGAIGLQPVFVRESLRKVYPWMFTGQ